jgi:hypothetical protein
LCGVCRVSCVVCRVSCVSCVVCGDMCGGGAGQVLSVTYVPLAQRPARWQSHRRALHTAPWTWTHCASQRGTPQPPTRTTSPPHTHHLHTLITTYAPPHTHHRTRN